MYGFMGSVGPSRQDDIPPAPQFGKHPSSSFDLHPCHSPPRVRGRVEPARWGYGRLVSTYKVVVVGTDGSESSFRAVDQAAAIAAEHDAKLIVATAYQPEEQRQSGEPDQLMGEDYKTQGNAPVYGMLREAADRARAAGATDVEERPI